MDPNNNNKNYKTMETKNPTKKELFKIQQPVKVIEKPMGIIEIWPSGYVARKNDGNERETERYANCLEFLYGHKIAMV